MQAEGLVKRYGQVTALDGADFELRAGEILAVIGDNGAGKSSLIKACRARPIPDEGEILLDGKPVHFKSPIDARSAGIETVYQDLAVAPAMTIAENLFLGRELRRAGFLGNVLRMLDKKKMLADSIAHMKDLKVGIRSMTQAVETLSGGQRQCVAVARAAAFAEHVVILDEPTAALGVKEGNMVLELIRRVRDKGLPVILISHNMPHVFEIADRIHIARLGKRAAVLNPKKISMSDTVAVMTGAMPPEELRPNAWPDAEQAAMLKGIDPAAHARAAEGAGEMGHGDEIVLADANFTATTLGRGKPVIRLPGVGMLRSVRGGAVACCRWTPMVAQPVAFMQVSDTPPGYRSALAARGDARLFERTAVRAPEQCRGGGALRLLRARASRPARSCMTGELQPCGQLRLQEGRDRASALRP